MNAIHGLWPTIVRRIVQGDVLDISLSRRSIEALVSRVDKSGEGTLNAFNIIGGIQLAISILCFLTVRDSDEVICKYSLTNCRSFRMFWEMSS